MTAEGPKYVEARRADGSIVCSVDAAAETWAALQRSYKVGELALPCGCVAVPKTSPLGTQFFAHVAGACQTAPETHWHLAAKALIHRTALSLGYSVTLEQGAASDGKSWRADVLVETTERKVAIEVQRSYQHLRDFEARQIRYAKGDVHAVWVLNREGYRRLTRTMARHRMRTEFGGGFPKDRNIFFPCLAELPVAELDFDPEPRVKGVRMFEADPREWLRAVVEARFVWVDGAWVIDEPRA